MDALNVSVDVCTGAGVYDGNAALSFDGSKLSSLIKNRGSRFRLDLHGFTLTQVINAYADFKRKMSPRYRNNNVLYNLRRLEEYVGAELMPIDVTDEFYVEAFNFFRSVENEKGNILKPSTIKTYFVNISAALSWASKHGCEIDPTFNAFKIQDYESRKVALTPSQIAHIYYYDINLRENRKKLIKTMKDLKCFRYSFGLIEKVRDMFVFDCNIGQRYSDAFFFDRSNFDETGTVYSCVQQKTGGKARVDLTKYTIDKKIAFEILKKYDYKCPAYKIGNANINKILHILCKSIGGEFDELLPCTNKIAGVIEKEMIPMWKLITSHTARRTFITYWCNSENISIVKLQKCSGHKDVKHLSRYCIDND